MSNFNNIINKILKTPSPPLSPHLPPLLLLLPLSTPSAASAPSTLAPPLGRCSCPLRPPPITSSRDIQDIPLLEEKEQEEEGEKDKEEDNNNAPASGPRYIIEFNIQYLVAIANTIIQNYHRYYHYYRRYRLYRHYPL